MSLPYSHVNTSQYGAEIKAAESPGQQTPEDKFELGRVVSSGGGNLKGGGSGNYRAKEEDVL